MPDDRLDELLLLWEETQEAGVAVSVEQLCRDCPELVPELQRRIDTLGRLAWLNDFGLGSRLGVQRHLAPGAEPVPGFRLEMPLGRGGFGDVWQATTKEGKAFALKFIPLGAKLVADELRVLERIRATRHPHLVVTHESIVIEDALVLVMELADQTLFDRWQDARRKGLAGVPREELFGYMRQAAEALDFLHEHDIHHRDIKPQNLLLVGRTLKVADFGLARLLEHSASAHSGAMTIAYAAPEFFEGATTRQSDQYCLAVTYCLLRGGRLPFGGNFAQIMAGHLRKAPDLSMLPAYEQPAAARALAKKPGERWPTCRAFVEELERGGGTMPRHWRRRTFIAASLVLSLVAATLFRFWPVDERGTNQSKGNDDNQTAPEKERSYFVFNGKSRIVTRLERSGLVTLEAWVNPGATEDASLEDRVKFIIGSDHPGKSGIGVGLEYRDRGTKALLIGQILPPRGRNVETTESVPLNQWSHVAAVFGEHETRLYLNGKQGCKDEGTENNRGKCFVIGHAGPDNPSKSAYFVGLMRDIRISHGERYSDTFTPRRMLTPDDVTMLLLQPEHVAKEVALDQSGKDNHGTMMGIVVRQPE
ncbi:MAG: protein kinase [Gemmataceae bacterium]|nr:protein kinase [Gemmataceae bacterium]